MTGKPERAEMGMSMASLSFLLAGCCAGLRLNLSEQVSHLDGGHGGFHPFVARLQSGTVHGLFQRLDRQYAERHGNAGFQGGGSHAFGGLRADVFKVGRISAQDRAQADDGIVAPGKRQALGRNRNLESTRNPHHVNVLAGRSGAVQSIQSALQQPLGNEGIEAADHDGEPQARCGQLALDFAEFDAGPVGWSHDVSVTLP